MLISVIVPFYKEIDLINRAVKSVFDQQVEENFDADFEILIGNDGSYSSQEIIEAIASEYRKKIIVSKNVGEKGPGGARNSAMACASGDCLAFLDADDYWLPGKMKEQVRCYSRGANFIATGYRFENGTSLFPPKSTQGKRLQVFKDLGIGTSTVMVSRELVSDTKFRDIRFGQDIDLWHRLSVKPNFKYEGINDCLVVYSTGGSTKNKIEQAKYFWKVLSKNDLSFLYKLEAFVRYGVRGIWNHFIR